MKIERDKVYLSGCGEKVRVVCVDGNAYTFPVVGLDEQGEPWLYTKTGGFNDDVKSDNDLVSEYVEPPKPREVWVSVYSDGDYGLAYKKPHNAPDPVGPMLVKFREVIEA